MSKSKNAVPPQQRIRDKSGRFIKGQTGNAHSPGRPQLREEFKQFAQEKSLETLKVVWAILTGIETNDKDKLSAARIMLEYGYGRPAAEFDRERLDIDVKRLAMDERKAELEQKAASGDSTIRIVLSDELQDLIG